MDLNQFVNNLRNKTLAERHAFITNPNNRKAIAALFSSSFSSGAALGNYVLERTSFRLNEQSEGNVILLISKGEPLEDSKFTGKGRERAPETISLSGGPDGSIIQWSRNVGNSVRPHA